MSKSFGCGNKLSRDFRRLKKNCLATSIQFFMCIFSGLGQSDMDGKEDFSSIVNSKRWCPKSDFLKQGLRLKFF